jgi:hypothetical protein
MTRKSSKSRPDDDVNQMASTIQTATAAGKNIWSIVITVGVFVATIWTTQQVVNTRLSFLEGEISTLKAKDAELTKQLSESTNSHQLILQEISNRLRDMELRFAELKTRVELVLDSRSTSKPSSSERPN